MARNTEISSQISYEAGNEGEEKMKICEFLINTASGKANFSFEVPNSYQSYVRLRLSM